MRTEYFGELEASVRAAWSHLGEQVTPSGQRCIAHVPQVGPKAWLHRFYPGCSESDLDAAEERMGRAIPPSWREALKVENGLMLFIIAQVSLCGVLPGGLLKRSIDDPQPFSLDDANTGERPRGALVAPDDFVIGYCVVDDLAKYLLRANESVVKVSREGDALLGTWPSVEEMLAAEYEVVAALHDRDGTFREA